MTRPAFLINNRQKAKWVARAVRGALSQTHPCYILLSDQRSTDGSMDIIRAEVENYLAQRDEYEGYPAFHTIKIVECPIDGPYGMRACNNHFDWCVKQLPEDCDMVFQCSSDDYSLPDRVGHCLHALSQLPPGQPVVGVCNAMFFENPGEINRIQIGGFPTTQGFIKPGECLTGLGYGSTIWAYKRDWLLKVGLDVNCTLDVYLGYLAALEGLYYVASPQHVHVRHADLENMGFEGKMRAASGDESLILHELNQYQLLSLYFDCIRRAQELHPEGISQEAQDGAIQMIVNHASGLLQTRQVLNDAGIRPGLLK